MQSTMHAYEVRPRKDKRGVDLISVALPFGRLLYGESQAVSNAVAYAQFYSCVTYCTLQFVNRRAMVVHEN